MEQTDPALELEARKQIYHIILSSPGLHFRELQRRTGMVTGALQYHLDFMKKRGLLAEEKDRDYSRFFVVDKLSEDEKKMLSFLRQETVRKILFFLIRKPNSRHKDIAEYVGISPSTLSWHLKRLADAAILKNTTRGRESYFRVSDSEKVVKLLISYRESFLDKLVDRFIESWAGK